MTESMLTVARPALRVARFCLYGGKTHANYTLGVNTMAVAHVRGLRDTGRELSVHMSVDGDSKSSASRSTATRKEPIIHLDDLEKYNITPGKYQLWKALSDIPDDKFESYLAPYLDGGELY